ncbi:aromatic acid exporter family protein [Actinomadura sp. ATCC 31491]|uniref:Aromatic acid exporter family protein n=1 Tax=Actinomadura luzonensis TaxID=2805427 RepID=A0ABT0FT19_9ACTN|nr:FUSC family protein [Actinomadura luzonensis]MCK2215477.1 aromatic acid exporter family protein [Actinomadura luzonensis]
MATETGRGHDPGPSGGPGGSPLGRILRGGLAALGSIRSLGLGRWLRMEREELIQTVKVTGACVLSWWLAAYVLRLELPVLVPIGVLLTVSATAYGTLVRGAQQVGAVVVGLGAAMGLIWLIGVNAVTLAVLVVAGLVLTRLLNLPAQNVQIPITALLVLSLGSTYGFARLADVLLGAAIGIAANLLILPPRFVEHAMRELCELSGELSELAADMAYGLRTRWGGDQAEDWLERARSLSRRLEAGKETTDQAAESVRLSLRRRRYDRRLRQVAEAATCLDHACYQLRGLARGLADLAAGVQGLPGEDATGLARPLAEELEALSRLFGAFGRLQLGGRDEDLRELRAALRDAEQRQALSRTMFERAGDDRLRSLQGALLEECARIRHEFDPDHGPHRDAFPGPA